MIYFAEEIGNITVLERMNEPKEIMNLHIELISSELHTFPQKGKVKVSERHGVYIIYTPTDNVLHAGNTPSGIGGLNQRLYNHATRTSSFSTEFLKPKDISLRNGYKFRFIEISNPRTRALLEALTAGLLCPAHLGTGEKKKKEKE